MDRPLMIHHDLETGMDILLPVADPEAHQGCKCTLQRTIFVLVVLAACAMAAVFIMRIARN